MSSHPIHAQNNIHAFYVQQDQIYLYQFATQLNWHMSNDLIGSYLPTRGCYHVRSLGMTKIQSYPCSKFGTYKTMSCTRIKYYDCRFIVDRESTRHDWCSFGKLYKSSEINSPMTDLHHLLLALVLVVLVGVMP